MGEKSWLDALDAGQRREVFAPSTGLVISQLYESFPAPAQVKLEPIIATLSADRPLPDDVSKDMMESAVRQVIIDTIDWLVQEDFLWNGPMKVRGNYQGALSLTSKSLLALDAFPGTLGQTDGLGNKLNEAVKDAGTTAGRAILTNLVGQFIGAIGRGFAGTH